MTIRERIIALIQKMPEAFLPELYALIKDFEAAQTQVELRPSLMAKLRNIKISAASDFSQTADLYP